MGPSTAPTPEAGRGTAWPRAHRAQLARSRTVPSAAAASAPIGRRERILVTEREVNGAPVVATANAIYHRPVDGPDWLRLGWEDVGRVAWTARSGTLTLTALPDSGSSGLLLHLPGPAPLVGLARERVGSTWLTGTLVWHDDRACAQVIARRQPGTGRISWIIAFSRAGDIEDSAVQAEVADAIDELRAEIGLPAR